MASVFDVAEYVLAKSGPMTTTKLQKLCYYAQGHHLAWDGVPLFPEPFQAWANGPVCFELFKAHRRVFNIERAHFSDGDPDSLSLSERETVDAVLDAYGHLSGHALSVMSHEERPWLEARGATPPGEASDAELDLDLMQEYFLGVIAADQV
ncbi:MAG: DUF4065 domain-containing protein [Bifidobacteriaceae bacterium]|nr:DUF4065 domain-containing protein [Bifidobacteriaceae bacterium]